MKLTIRQKQIFFFSTFLLGITASQAFAGFEWRGLPQQAQPHINAAPPVNDTAPIQWQNDGPAVVPQKVTPVETAPIVMAPTKPSVPMNNEPVISGFASDLPLSMALPQVIPQGYNFKIAPGVDPDTTVSWNGGKPWPTVLDEMLAPKNLVARMDHKNITIERKEGTLEGSALPPKPKAAGSNKADLIPADILEPLPPVTASSSTVGDIEWDKKDTAPITIRRQKQNDDMTAVEVDTPKAMPPVMLLPDVGQADVAAAPLTQNLMPERILQDKPWRVAKGQTLRQVLTEWCAASGIELYWAIDYDYRLNNSDAYTGNFEDAVGKLLDQFSGMRPQPYGKFHAGSGAADVLVIDSYDITP